MTQLVENELVRRDKKVFDDKTQFFKLHNMAMGMALEVYFRNENRFANWWAETGVKYPLVKIFMGGILPFPRVASNIMVQMYRHSPLGFISAIRDTILGNMEGTDDFIAKLSRRYGEATTGTFLTILGVVLASIGVIGFGKEEYDGIVLKIGDFEVKLSELAPSISPILIGASIVAVSDDTTDIGQKIFGSIYEQTLLGNFNSMFKFNATLDQALISQPLESYMLQYIPSLFKSVAKVVDPGMKKTTGPFEFFYRVAASLPIVSLLVPNKIDPYTGQILNRNDIPYIIDIVNVFNPLKFKYKTYTIGQEEALRVGAETAMSTGRIVFNGEAVILRGKDLEQYSIVRGEAVQKMIKELIVTKTYLKMDQEERQKALSSVYEKATQYAKIDYWLRQGNKFVYQSAKDAQELKRYIGNVPGVIVMKSHKGSRFLKK